MAVQSVEEEVQWGEEDVAKLVQSAARRARNRFHGYVAFEDTLQEAWLAVYNTSKLAQWQSEGQAGKDRLYRHVLKACALYGHQEKAAALGYRYSDLFFYSLKLMREVLPDVLNSYTEPAEEISGDPSVRMDVHLALSTLTDSEYQIIWWAFKGDPGEEEGYANVAGHLSISSDAARQRVNRLLRRMQDVLGGENPSSRRHRKTTAQALAETRNAWEGEG